MSEFSYEKKKKKHTVSTVGFTRTKWAELLEFITLRRGTRLTRCTPAHWLANNDSATTTARLGDERCRRIQTLTVSEMSITYVTSWIYHTINLSQWVNQRRRQVFVYPSMNVRLGPRQVLVGTRIWNCQPSWCKYHFDKDFDCIRQCLINKVFNRCRILIEMITEERENRHTDAGFSIGREFVAWIADTFERAVHVDTLAIVAHACLSTLVHVDTERTDGRTGETFFADTFKRAGNVLTAPVKTNTRILGTFIQI